jgi:hypothetical protein
MQIYFDNGSTSFPKAPGMSDAMKAFLDGARSTSTGAFMKPPAQ